MAKKVGSSGGDVLTGGSAGDQLSGQAGDDLLHGGAGNDTLYGGWGDDRLSGGDNDDLLHGHEGNDQLDGGAGIDKLYGDDGNDQLDGGGGNDQLYGGWGDDLLIGGEGHDTLSGGHGADYLDGGAGNDLLHGDEGDDQLDGGDGSDKLYGDGGNDQLNGGTGNDKLYGGWGDDRLSGGDGVDLLDGQKGNDQLDGGSGDDTLYGDGGNDQLDGGIGHDKLDGGFGDDRLSGGDGIDLLNGQKGDDQLDGGAGGDTLYGRDGNDQLAGGTGNDKLYGDGGNDLFTYRTGDGNDVVDGGQGDADTIRLEVDDGWILKLSKGKVVSNDGDHIGLSGGAAGTIKLADGSTISFKGMERIDASPPQGGNLAPVDLAFLGDPVDETAPDGSVVGTATASDPDAGDTLTYSLTNDAGGRFAIDPSTGAITVVDASRLDHESTGQHQITIKATDAGGLSTSKTFTIEVADANEAPGSLDLDANEVAEGVAGGTVVGSVSASDPDAGDALTFTLTDDAGGRFAIDPTTGEITVGDGGLLDHDAADQHSIEVRVTDAGGLSATRTFTIAVADVNDAPGAVALSTSTVAEGAAEGTVVGIVSATDPNADPLTYSLTDDAGGRFTIDPNTGVITVADGAPLDRETERQHGIEVRVTDSGGLSTSRTFTIAVTDVNETPGGLALSASGVHEGAADGTAVGTVGATDPDIGEVLTYSLTDDAGGRFVIDPGTGEITVADGVLLDFEASAEHSIEVRVTDAGGLSASQTFTITVANANEAPAIQSLEADEVPENAADGTVVGTVGATDPDNGDTPTYSLTNDTGGRFAIDPSTGVITVADGGLLDFETAGQHSIEVKVVDAGGLDATQTFTITVANTNEAPAIQGLDTNAVLENAADGTLVGAVGATDPDVGDTLSYSLTDDAGGRFAIDASTGVITVADGSLLDFETTGQHSIEVKVADASGLSATQTFTIAVGDANETPAILDLDANEVLETAADGTVVGTVGASDPDGGDTLTYSLTDDAGGRFAIDPHTGVVTVLDGGLLDHDVADQHAVTVNVTDAGGLSSTETFTIAVAAVNAPVIHTLDADDVAENAAAGTVIGTVTATDSDPGDTLTYALSDDAGGRFAIDPSTGVITVADGALLDFEAADQHAIEVEVTDGDGLSTTRTFTIAVSDVNEAPAIQALDANEIHEGAATGTVIGAVGASDPDAGDTLTFALTDDADGRFAIDPSTGVITVADGALLDFETAGQHSLEVEVTDGQGLSATQTFAIAVTNVNEAPVIHDLNAGEVLEGTVDGTMVGTVTATDPDMGDTLTYTLSDDAGGRFTIDQETGVVTVADGSLINHGTADQHSIVVTVTDADGLSAEATYLIQVQPDNSGNNILNGDGAANVIDGGPGDDTINGGGGDDHLLGGSGDDTLNGDEGNDRLEGGDGNDFLFGHGGDDHLIGGGGDDQLLSGVGNDRLDGGDGDDQLFGNGGDDAMDGGDGDDELFGSVGADVLTGGLGNDFLSGGMGSDRFVLTSAGEGVDEVFDFGASDVLAIGGMLEGFAAGDEAAFVKLVDDGTNTTLQVDVDGAANGEAYQSVAVLTGVTGTTLADLVDAGQLDFWMS